MDLVVLYRLEHGKTPIDSYRPQRRPRKRVELSADSPSRSVEEASVEDPKIVQPVRGEQSLQSLIDNAVQNEDAFTRRFAKRHRAK